MSKYNTRDRGYLWMSLADGVPIQRKRDILDRLGRVDEVYENFVELAGEIIDIVGNNNFAKLSYAFQDEIIDGEIEKMEREGVDIVTYDSEYYPPKLRGIDDPPLLLYVKGDKEALIRDNLLAVVGTRRPSRYGKEATKFLVRDVAKAGVTIVSGLARGVDAISHKMALEEGANTIAVVANGLDMCYPEENYELMSRIIEHGAVVSEYPLGATPYAYRFPERNRIISGMSDGVLVTEAGRHSGSLITLNYALDQGKNVYIVPGPIDTASCMGSNDALKSLQGGIVTDASDILKDYDLELKNDEKEDFGLQDYEKELVEFIREQDRHIDEICAHMEKMEINSVLALLAKLELYGLIERLPGNYYGK